MTPADLARENAISFECKKDVARQLQNGDWKLALTIQRIDMNANLTNALPGTRYMAVLVQIGDDELPINQPAKGIKTFTAALQPSQPQAGAKRDWNDVQPAAQSGIRCAEPTFRAFLRETRCLDVQDKLQAEIAVRDICGVNSRVEFSTNPAKARLWRSIDTSYQAWLAKERVGA